MSETGQAASAGGAPVASERGASASRLRTPGTRAILITLVVAVVLVALITPQPGSEGGGYSTRSTDPRGARAAYDLGDRLGWPVVRRETELSAPAGARTVHMLFGSLDIDARETHWLLESVRAGGAIVIAGDVGDLADSLGFESGPDGHLTGPPSGAGVATGQAPTRCAQGGRGAAPRSRLSSISLATLTELFLSIRWRRPPPSPPVVFAQLLTGQPDSAQRVLPAIIGVTYGTAGGRIVIATDGDVVANDVIRNCDQGFDVAFIRALEYVRARRDSGTDSLVFDEYHHGFGAHPGSLGAVAHYVRSTQSGHALGQAALAALLLLMAAAPRPIAPRDPERIVRRSPLEHADALAHAYETVKATRTVVARLLSGVRRRAGSSRGAQRLDDAAFLRYVGATYPSVAGDVDVVSRALGRQVRTREMPTVGAALDRIEAAITRSAYLGLPAGGPGRSRPRQIATSAGDGPSPQASTP